MSVELPGAKATTMRIGLSGQAAWATPHKPRAAVSRQINRVFITSGLLFGVLGFCGVTVVPDPPSDWKPGAETASGGIPQGARQASRLAEHPSAGFTPGGA